MNDGLTSELTANPSPKVLALCMLSGEEVAVHAADYLGKLEYTSVKAVTTVLAYGEMLEKSEEMLFLLFKHFMENEMEFTTDIFNK